jgi:hypothetical protein
MTDRLASKFACQQALDKARATADPAVVRVTLAKWKSMDRRSQIVRDPKAFGTPKKLVVSIQDDVPRLRANFEGQQQDDGKDRITLEATSVVVPGMVGDFEKKAADQKDGGKQVMDVKSTAVLHAAPTVNMGTVTDKTAHMANGEDSLAVSPRSTVADKDSAKATEDAKQELADATEDGNQKLADVTTASDDEHKAVSSKIVAWRCCCACFRACNDKTAHELPRIEFPDEDQFRAAKEDFKKKTQAIAARFIEAGIMKEATNVPQEIAQTIAQGLQQLKGNKQHKNLFCANCNRVCRLNTVFGKDYTIGAATASKLLWRLAQPEEF